MLLLFALAQAAVGSAVTVPPTGPALTAEIRTRDSQLFSAFFGRCDREAVAAFITPDFEMYHDKGGKLAGGAAVFLDDYMRSCTAAAKADGWRHRRELIEASLRVEAVPGFGAIEEETTTSTRDKAMDPNTRLEPLTSCSYGNALRMVGDWRACSATRIAARPDKTFPTSGVVPPDRH